MSCRDKTWVDTMKYNNDTPLLSPLASGEGPGFKDIAFSTHVLSLTVTPEHENNSFVGDMSP